MSLGNPLSPKDRSGLDGDIGPLNMSWGRADRAAGSEPPPYSHPTLSGSKIREVFTTTTAQCRIHNINPLIRSVRSK